MTQEGEPVDKLQTNPHWLRTAAVIVGAVTSALAPPAHETDTAWTGAISGLWSDTGNWASGVAATGDTARFGNDAVGNFMVDLDGDRTVNDLILEGNTPYRLFDDVLSLESGNLRVTSTGHQIDSDVVLLADGVWDIHSWLTLNGAPSGGFSLTQPGGLLRLNGANTYTGGTTLSGGTLRIVASHATSRNFSVTNRSTIHLQPCVLGLAGESHALG